MKIKRIIGITVVLMSVIILVYFGILTLMQYEEYGEMDWPAVLRGLGFSGYITAVNENELEIKDVNGNTAVFVTNKGTRILAEEDFIREGSYVKVIYKPTKEGDKEINIAKAIRVPKEPAQSSQDENKSIEELKPDSAPVSSDSKPQFQEEEREEPIITESPDFD